MSDKKNIQNNRLERIFILAKNDFRQRYFDSYFGVLWALINPIARVSLFYVVFSMIFVNQTENFALYLFLGIILWLFFSETTKKGIGIYRHKSYILKNVKINKLDIFISSTLSTFIGFFFNLLIYFAISLFFNITYSINLIFLPLVLLNAFVFIMAIQMILSVLYAFFRDINHFWDIVLLAGFWSIPIIWKQDIVFQKASFLLYINPLTGILINLREVIFFNKPPHMLVFLYSTFFSLILLLIGIFLVRKFSYKSIEKL